MTAQQLDLFSDDPAAAEERSSSAIVQQDGLVETAFDDATLIAEIPGA